MSTLRPHEEIDQIDKAVNDLIANPTINNPVIPDALESTIYTYAIKCAVAAVKVTLGWLATRVTFVHLLPLAAGIVNGIFKRQNI